MKTECGSRLLNQLKKPAKNHSSFAVLRRRGAMAQLTAGAVKDIYHNSAAGNNGGRTSVLQVCRRPARLCCLFVGEDALAENVCGA